VVQDGLPERTLCNPGGEAGEEMAIAEGGMSAPIGWNNKETIVGKERQDRKLGDLETYSLPYDKS
jgi:hypothetical protein